MSNKKELLNLLEQEILALEKDVKDSGDIDLIQEASVLKEALYLEKSKETGKITTNFLLN